jgi:hypothetical protein
MPEGSAGVAAESWRVAQLAVERGPDEHSRGSGYLVAPGRVLTAAHVLAGASVVRVLLDVGQPTEVSVRAEGWWADPKGSNGTDLAVVMIAADATAGRAVEPARFSRISDGTAIFPVQAFGFPASKFRPGPADEGEPGLVRDLDQVSGHVPVAANRRQGTLAVYLDDPPPATRGPGGPSPWAGMSGAAVWAADRIVAVLAEHHPSEGTGRLTARRIDRAYEQLSGLDLGRLVQWLELAPAVDGLPDVVPAEPGQFIRSAYLEQVRDIAPDELIGRDGELAEWAEFCAGPDSYTWWQAGPWAGKTALASWFVTHPPAGIDVVSFFITGRLVGQADSDAFVDAMIEQLDALAPLGRGSPAAAGARVGTWLSLLASVASQAEERGRRLVVVVDGLDEDDAGARPPRGRPSIASLLPRRPSSGARFIVTSRPDPGLPDDVPSGHPLRSCLPRELPVSRVGEDLAMRAKQELRDLLSEDQTAIDIVGYIAGSGGGLARSDLSALTGAPPLKLDPILRGVFGRSLQTRAIEGSRHGDANPAERVYLFAHETLRVTAEEQLGAELARYRQRIHDWIDSYANLDWPDTTPGYAIWGYRRLLTAASDAMRLAALARDPRRHAFLLRASGSEYAALSEIRSALRLIADQDMPDLQILLELAVYRHAISFRNQFLPSSLPAVWERLGRLDHAEALARTIVYAYTQQRALIEMATAVAQAGNPDRAEALARTITDPGVQASALAELADVATQASDVDRTDRLISEVETLARTTIADPEDLTRALAQVAGVAARAGDADRASRLAAEAETLAHSTFTDPADQAGVLTVLLEVAAQAGDAERVSGLAAEAQTLARTLTRPGERVGAWAWALVGLAAATAQAGEPDRAEALARTITSPEVQARALTELAKVAARNGDADRASQLVAEAETLARALTSPRSQARALAWLASDAAQAGDPDRVSGLVAEAETLARTTFADPEEQAVVLAWLARIAAEAGDPDRAEALARIITDPQAQAEAFAGSARAAVEAGDLDRASRLAAEAEAVARTAIIPYYQARALDELATAAVQAGDPDRAAALARTIASPDEQFWSLAGLAEVAAQAGDAERASRLVIEAATLARTLTYLDSQGRALAELAGVAAQAGDPDRASLLAAEAETLARTTITDPADQARVFTVLVGVAARAGNLDRAEALARTLTDPEARVQLLTELATVVAEAGDPDRASRLAAEAETPARMITGPDAQARALTALATVVARTDDADRAFRLAGEAETLARTAITDPKELAWMLAELAGATALAGDLDRAEALAHTITDPETQVRALTELATAVAQAGDAGRGFRLVGEAETLARTAITDPTDLGQAVAGLASAAVQAGDLDRAEALAHTITDPEAQARALTELASAVAQAGDAAHAHRLWALALSADSPEVISRIAPMSHCFPAVIRGAGDVFLSAYNPRP